MLKKTISSLMLLCCSYKGFAADTLFQAIYSSLAISIDGGPVWEGAGQAQMFFLTPNVQNTYTAQNKTHQLNTAELFVGVHQALGSQWRGEFGVSIAAMTTATIHGEIWQDASVEFNNFTYSWKANDTRLSVKGKLVREAIWHDFSPYASVSLGAGFNHAGHYQSTPLINEVIADPNFASSTTTALAYGVGIGVQHALNRHLQAGIGYEFVDWGKNALDRAPGQTMSSGLYMNHLYTNGLVFTLSYLA